MLWATVTAAVFAWLALGVGAVALYRGNVIASNADEALVRERRSTFELGVLARLVEVSGHGLPGSLQMVCGLLQVLPNEDLPGKREEIARGVIPSNDLLDMYLEEYKQAVDRRLHGANIRPKYRSR